MQITEWPIERLKPYEDNPRKISDESITSVENSIRKFGFRQPIVANPGGIIIVGHTRFEASKRLALKSVPVHVMDVDDDTARAYRVADNRTGELADWDIPLLSAELKALDDLNVQMQKYGFTEAELEMARINDLGVMTGDEEEPWGGDVEGYVSRKKSDPRCIVYFGTPKGKESFFEWLATQDANYRKQQSTNECYVAYIPARSQNKFRTEDTGAEQHGEPADQEQD